MLSPNPGKKIRDSRKDNQLLYRDEEWVNYPVAKGSVGASTNLTVGELFPRNSSGGRTYCCQCAVVAPWGEPPHVPRTPGDRRGKLLADAQRAAKATSNPGRQYTILQDEIRRKRSPANENAEGEATRYAIQAGESGPRESTTPSLGPTSGAVEDRGIRRQKDPCGYRKLGGVSTKMAMKEVQIIEENIGVLEDVGRDPEAKVIEELMRYELDEPGSDRFFLVGGRRSAPEHVDAVIEEVEKLRVADAIVEVLYPSWLSNTVVIDQLVDSTSGHARMSFLDAYTGYHQITLHGPDQEKTAFMTPRGVFCYKVMPFELKNAGATYQIMVTKMFNHVLGKTMDAYIDDMLRHNAAKCAFGVGLGKFLGHLVTRRGIEGNPEQIAAIDQIASPRNAKEVQKLAEMAAVLNRFISKSSDKCCPFFKLLRKNAKFSWDEESEMALQQFKKYLTKPPLLSTLEEGELLHVYLVVSEHAVSSVLLREVVNEQRLIYFVSKTLTDCQTRYLPLEKLVLALVVTSCKLMHYFQAHPISVYTEFPLKAILMKVDLTGQLSKWALELGQFDISFLPRAAIKGQVLADFMAEFSPKPEIPGQIQSKPLERGGNSQNAPSELRTAEENTEVNPESPRERDPAELKELPEGAEVTSEPPQAEYEALIAGLRSASRLGVPELCVYSDSKLVVNQVGREFNAHADALTSLASTFEGNHGRTVAVDVISVPSIEEAQSSVLVNTQLGLSWMDPIVNYLRTDQLPDDRKEAHKIRIKAAQFWISPTGDLYKRSYQGPYLLGYWWPYMQKDAQVYVRRCNKCQLFSPLIHQPARDLSALTSPWPFAQWGMDIIGVLPRAPGNKRFLLVATDYFTKWVETEPLAQIRETDVIRFIRSNILSRFGIPRAFVSDNGTQFVESKVRGLLEQLKIEFYNSTPSYPQCNGQAEATNKTIMNGIKKRLEKAKGRWVDELANVLWAYRTTPRKATNEMPYSLAFGFEAVIPLRRENALIRMADYQKQLAKSFNQKVQRREFEVGSLVLRKVVGNTKDPTDGKLAPN
ncbi:hypothetical protein Acr_00g0068110 [Actinidia rufa]|uniref:Integrase catalytic domain-containing protein n=1 Tax=Actinidia rufa TaxID=165716 RepID=A0A7J0DQN9_9ERIC|nr:hypothetical protein Acr_00g0068110 [Actinidia rufa]